jgi:transposase-like protein
VEQDGDVLDILVQSRRNKEAAKKFFRKLLKRLRYVPRALITDKLKSYRAAKAELMPSVEHLEQKYQNNRAEIHISDQIAREGDEALQVRGSCTAFSFCFRNHYLTLPSGTTPVQH